eukprot:985544-Alexandrium_andersonii.AAC.1
MQAPGVATALGGPRGGQAWVGVASAAGACPASRGPGMLALRRAAKLPLVVCWWGLCCTGVSMGRGGAIAAGIASIWPCCAW